MALFGKKKGEVSVDTEGSPGSASGAPVDPVRAARFFEHAKTAHETSNPEYAMTLWLQGVERDPSSVTGLEGFFRSSAAFLSSNKKGPTKEQARNFDGKSEVSKYVTALLAWGCRPTDGAAAVKATELASKLGMAEPTYWLGQHAINAAAGEPKPRKDHFVRLKDALVRVGAYDLGLKAGQVALTLDPSDSPLDAEMRNLAAQNAMSQGGYEATGEAGGFRANIRNAEAQRRIEEESRSVKSEQTAGRVLEAAREDYERRPADTVAIEKYVRALLDSGGEENEKAAGELLVRTYEATKEFRFRQRAGELKLRRAGRKLAGLKEKAAGGDEQAVREAREYERRLIEEEIKELLLCVEAYPTDLSYRYQLGKRYLLLGRHEDAIGCFQESQNDGKVRTVSLGYLGQSFHALGMFDESAQSFRTALDSHGSPKDELGLNLRYGLMKALFDKARESRDLTCAEEALRLASGIVMEKIGFKDIRALREAIQKLVAELKA